MSQVLIFKKYIQCISSENFQVIYSNMHIYNIIPRNTWCYFFFLVQDIMKILLRSQLSVARNLKMCVLW